MAEPVLPSDRWDQLTADAQAAFAWAAATEQSGEVVGTRGLLLGLMLERGARSEPSQLLEHFGLTQPQLVAELRNANPYVTIDPEPSAPDTISALPALSPNLDIALQRAWAFGQSGGSTGAAIDTAHLFGGVLRVPECTGYTALAAVLGSDEPLRIVAAGYEKYVMAGDTDFRSFLERILPERRPTPPEVKDETVASSSDDAGAHEEREMTPSARRVLAYAAALLDTRRKRDPDVGIARAAILLGALQDAVEGNLTVARPVLDAVYGDSSDAGPRLDAAAAAVGMDLSQLSGQRVVYTAGGLVPLEPIIVQADRLVIRTGASLLHLRHVLAAALGDDAPALPDAVVSALGTSRTIMRSEVRRAIAEFAPADATAAWDAILAAAADTFDLGGGVSRDAVDPNCGIPLGEDRLGVRTYVAMLGAVIADHRTPEPLSIGLFGEWGSGKSYFMGLLREQVRLLSEHGDPYLGSIRQIGFNAWHYADTNIWASLGDEIFEQLAGTMSLKEERQALESELARRMQERSDLEAATERAQAESTRLSEQLDVATASRRNSAKALAEAVATSPTVSEAWRRLGVDDPVEQGELLAAELRGSVSDVVALRQAVAGRRGVYIAALGLIAAVLIVVAAAAPRAQSWLAGTGASAIFVLLGLAAGFVHRVHSGLRTLRTAATEISATLERNRDADPEVRTALGKLREAESRQVVLQAQHDKVVERVGELGRQLAELAPGQRLSRFVEERAESEDYRRHLGVISTVRKDFEHLVELLKDWRDEGGAQGKVQIDRIVLYIDDLDRCSSRQVVEVLQAVHLLLALDLFVVVVGVDPRWLLRALQSEYDKLLTGEEGEWQASPHDYLEKIFNIPFTLPKMNTVSFGTLLRSFAGDNGAAPTARDGLPGADATNGAIQEQPEVAPDRAAELPTPEVDFVAEERSEAAAATAGAAEIPILPLTPPELDLLTALAPLVGTPREAKRLVNLYRIVRSTRDLSAASRFLGDETTAGEYQAVIILLGLLSGHSRLLESLLAAPAKPQLKPALGGGLVHRPRTSSWGVFAAGIEPRTAGNGWENDIVGALPEEEVRLWQDLHRGLAEATKLVTLHNLDAFQSWAPRIARFSFLLSPSLAEPVPAAAENGAGKRSAAPSLS